MAARWLNYQRPSIGAYKFGPSVNYYNFELRMNNSNAQSKTVAANVGTNCSHEQIHETAWQGYAT